MSEQAPITPDSQPEELFPRWQDIRNTDLREIHGAESNLLIIDMHNRVSTQVLQDARERRREDLIGLTGEKTGQLFVVRAQDENFHKEEEHHRKSLRSYIPHIQYPDTGAGGKVWHTRIKTEEKRVAVAKRIAKGNLLPHPYKVGYAVTFGWKPIKHKRKLIDTKAYAVDFYDKAGNLTSMKYLTHDDFMGYLDGENEEPRQGGPFTTHFYWNTASPEVRPSPGWEHIPVPIKKDQSIFDQVSTYQETHLPEQNGLEGLTWNRHGHTLQIVRDTRMVLPGSKTVGVWMVKVRDPQKRVVERRIYRDNELDKYFQRINSTPGESLENMHWEIPRKPEIEDPLMPHLSEEQRAWLTMMIMHGQVPGPKLVREISGAQDIAEDEMWEALNSQDVYGDDPAQLEDIKRAMATQPDQIGRYGEAFKRLVTELGLDAVKDLAARLRDTLVMTELDLGIKPVLEAYSVSWALRDMFEEQYYAQHPSEARRGGAEVLIGDPFGDDAEAQNIRLWIVDRQLGKDFEEAAILIDPRVAPIPRINADGQPMSTIVLKKRLAEEPLGFLPNLIRDAVKEILNQSIEEEALDDNDYARLGRMLRRSVRR